MLAENSSDFWQAQLTDNYHLLQKAVSRRFIGDPENTENALSYVSEKLLEDDMRRLRLYDPDRGARFTTYLSVVVQRLISGYLNQNTKRRRFPKWLEDQNNAFWFLVYRLLCWEKMKENEAAEYLQTSAPDGREHHVIEEAIYMVRTRYPNCADMDSQNISMDAVTDDFFHEQKPDMDSSFHQLPPDEQIVASQRTFVFQKIINPSDKECDIELQNEKLAMLKKKIDGKFKAPPTQRLFLKMIYYEGMGVSAAGRLLGWNANQAAGQHRRLLAQLRTLVSDDELESI